MENPAEVQELRNKLRMMKFPQEEILNTVRKQQRAIHKQKQANDTIRSEIEEYEKQINHLQALSDQHKSDPTLQRLLRDHKILSNKLSSLKADCDAEAQKLAKLEDEASKARSKAGGMFAAAAENESLANKQLTMENRLQQVYNKYNTNLRVLEDLRADLDHFRKDRNQNDSVMAQKKAQREKAEAELQGLISKSNDMYTERDALKMETVTLKNAEKEDVALFEQDMTRYNQTIEAQKINNSRPMDAQPSVVSVSSTMGSQSDAQEEVEAQIKEYNATINKVLQIAGVENLDQLVDKTDSIERENFTLYSFVVEHSSRLAELQQQNQQLEEGRDAFIESTDVDEEKQTALVAEMSTEIKNLEDMIRVTEEQNEKTKQDFETVYSGVEEIFNDLGCSWEGSPNESEHISTQNVMFGLSLIEKVVADLTDTICERATVQLNEQGTDLLSLSQIPTESRALESSQNTRSTIFGKNQTLGPQLETARPMTLEELKLLIG